ncbi:hypothetical protein [Qipengyuania soli]|uniref:Uncharacterized protein n=1 Tax=Qipengyuania soli TaxID=2782568 RepID=A0A7S8F609_9SPHN|nr:hypothetical protein [Qipengyuania soli]QPC99792.1 hypothetical protein IRL76_04390 [Qipengyuania soli]
MVDTPETDPERDFGVLLGWKATPAGNQTLLIMQSTRKTPQSNDDVREFRYFITKEQAVLLGNYLYMVAGETPPRRKRPGLIERILSR